MRSAPVTFSAVSVPSASSTMYVALTGAPMLLHQRSGHDPEHSSNYRLPFEWNRHPTVLETLCAVWAVFALAYSFDPLRCMDNIRRSGRESASALGDSTCNRQGAQPDHGRPPASQLPRQQEWKYGTSCR